MQFGESTSVTNTLVSVTAPVLVTSIVKFAVPPLAIVCDAGSFVIEIAGVPGGGVTKTTAEAVAVTFGPVGGVPVATATFVKPAVTPASEQL